MKKLTFLFIFPLVFLACSAQTQYEKAISDYLQIKDGVKTDLKIEFLDIKITDITVADSISILQEQFKNEKATKIESAQKSVNHYNAKIEEQKGKKNQLVAKALISGWMEDLAKAENVLTAAQEWKPNYLDHYVSRNSSDILAKKADCRFSYLNPKIQTRQDMKAIFILSVDGEKCNNMIK